MVSSILNVRQDDLSGLELENHGTGTVRDLEILLQVSQLVGRLTTFDELSQRLLDLILSATESEHIALMLDPHGPIHAKEFSLNSVRQLPARQGPFTVSRTLVQRVLENGECIDCKEVAGEAWLKRGKQRYGEPVFARRCVCPWRD